MGKLRYFLTAIAYVLFSTVYSQGIFIDGSTAPDPYSGALAKTNKIIADRIAAKDVSKRGSVLKSVAEEDVWTIPVVVHVIHKGGPIDFDLAENDEDEALRLNNVSRYQITGALDVLSERFRATVTKPYFENNDLSIYANDFLTEYDDPPFSTDMGIQFQLATVDPNGNPTDGIVRHDMSGSLAYNLYGTIAGDITDLVEGDSATIDQAVLNQSLDAGYPVNWPQMMEEWGWPSHEYLNIYLTTEINDNDGSCVQGAYRTEAPSSPVIDGSINSGVLWNSRLVTSGRFGQLYGADGYGAARFVKSLGGLYGLLPVWTGYTNCASLMIERDSLYGDGVADTPPNINGCGCGFLCGDPEDFPGAYVNGTPDYRNYMDGQCGGLFTPGQADRLRAFMEEYWPTFAVSNNPKVQPVAYADIAVEVTAERIGQNLYYPTAIVKNLGNTDITNWNLEVTVPGSGISVTRTQADFGTLPSGEQFNIKLPVFQLTELRQYDIVANISSGQNAYGGNDESTYSFEKVFDVPVTVGAGYFANGTFSDEPRLGIVPAEGNDLYEAYIGNGFQQIFNRPIEDSPYGAQNFIKDPRKLNQGKFSWYNAYWQNEATQLDPRASWAINAEQLRSDFSLVDRGDSLILEDTYYLTEGDWTLFLQGTVLTDDCASFWAALNGVDNPSYEPPTHSRLAAYIFNCWDRNSTTYLYQEGNEDLTWCNVSLDFNGSELFYEDQTDILSRLHPMCTGSGFIEHKAVQDSLLNLINDVRNNPSNPLYEDQDEIERLWDEKLDHMRTWNSFCGGIASATTYNTIAKTPFDPNISASSVTTLDNGDVRVDPWLKFNVSVSQDNPYVAPTCLNGGATGDGVCPNLGATNYNTDLSLGYVYQRDERAVQITAQINNPGYYTIDSIRYELSTDPGFAPASTEVLTLRANHIGERNMGLVAADQKHKTVLPITVGVFSDLSPNTTYYYRAIAGNTEVSDQFTSVGFSCEGIGDSLEYNGIMYDIVSIGNQCWFARDLATDQFANGDPITSGSSTAHPRDWADNWIEIMDNDPTVPLQVTPRPRYNGDDVSDRGSLYNYAAVQDERGICPIGWRVPSQADINELYGEVRNRYGTNDPAVLKHALYDFDHPDAISQYTNNLGFKFRASNHSSFTSYENIPNRTWMTNQSSPWFTDMTYADSFYHDMQDNNFAGSESYEDETIDVHAIGVIEKTITYNSQFYIPGFTEEVAVEIPQIGISNNAAFQYMMKNRPINGKAFKPYGLQAWLTPSTTDICSGCGTFPPATYEEAEECCGSGYSGFASFMNTGMWSNSGEGYWALLGQHPNFPAVPDTSYTNVSTDPIYMWQETEWRKRQPEKGYEFIDAMWISDAYKDHRKELWLFHPGQVAAGNQPIQSIGNGGSPVYWDSVYAQYKAPSEGFWFGGTYINRGPSFGTDVLGGIFNEKVLRPLDYADEFTFGELQRIGRANRILFPYDSWEWAGYPKEMARNPERNYTPGQLTPDSDFRNIVYKSRGTAGDRFGSINRDDVNMFNVPEGQLYLPTSINTGAVNFPIDSTDFKTSFKNGSGGEATGWYEDDRLGNGVEGYYLSNDEQQIAAKAFMGLRTRCVTGGTEVPDVNLNTGTLHSKKCAIKDSLVWGYQPVWAVGADPDTIAYFNPSQYAFGHGQSWTTDDKATSRSTSDVIIEDYGWTGHLTGSPSQNEQIVQCLSWTTPCNFNLALQEEPTDENGFEIDILRDEDVFAADACGDCELVSEFLTNIEQGYCDCEGNVLDALGLCGGTCNSDENNNGICDFLESAYQAGCGDITSVNYSGHTYDVLSVGPQCWFTENLRTSVLNTGQFIPEVQNGENWKDLETPGRAAYDNLPANFEDDGWLYNWYAVETGRLCPSGWHVPTDDDWADLERLLGMSENEVIRKSFRGTEELIGSRLKPGGTTSLNLDAGGLRVGRSGLFKEGGKGGYFWTSTPANDRRPSRKETAIHRAVDGNSTGIARYSDSWSTAKTMKHGLSVRCVLDSE